MAKRFKLKISRVIPSFPLCRSKKASNLPETPVSVIHGLSPVNPKALDISRHNIPAPPPSTPDYSFIELHLSPKIVSVGCGWRARSCTEYLSPDVSFESPDDSRKKEATRLHIVAKAHDSKLQRKTYEASVSYENMEKVKQIDSGCSSSKGAENDETETLISTSRSFSDDSSFELDQSVLDSRTESSLMETIKNKKKVNSTKTTKRLRMLRRTTAPPGMAEGKVRESVAVVKKSEDPFEDFKRSMLDMILEKQMFEAKDLEHLLQCFLSLNSRQQHGIIVEAFTEIWEALFCEQLTRNSLQA